VNFALISLHEHKIFELWTQGVVIKGTSSCLCEC